MEFSIYPTEELKIEFTNWLIEQSPKNFKSLNGFEIFKPFIKFKYGSKIEFERKDFQFLINNKRDIIDEIKIWLDSFQLTFDDYKIYYELFLDELDLSPKVSFVNSFETFNLYLKDEGFIIEKEEINKSQLLSLFQQKINSKKDFKESEKQKSINIINLNCTECGIMLTEEELKRRSIYKYICLKCVDIRKKINKKNYKLLNPEKNKEQKRRYKKNRMKRDVTFKILHRLRTRILLVLNGKKKAESSMNLLGCTAEDFKKHIESKFKDDMNWENYGIKGWHIDHIIPCASFDLNKIEEQKKCFHYSNLQPLWWFDNLSKADKIE